VTYPPQQPAPWPGQPPYGSGGQPDPYGQDPGAYGGSNGYGPGYGPQDYVEPSAPPGYGPSSAPPSAQPSGPPGYDPGYDPGYGPGYQEAYGYQQPGYAPPQPFGGPGYAPPPMPPPAPKKSSPLPWIIGGGAALIVVVLVIVTAVVMTGGKKHPSTATSSSASASASPSPSISLDPTRVTDPATGLSYKKLGSPWVPLSMSIREFRNPVGQQVKTQNTGNGWYAVITMGALDTGAYPYTGPADLQKTTDTMAGAMIKKYYPANVKTDKKFSDEGGTQNGHQAWVWAYHVSYSESGVDSKGESVEIALVDLGNGKAGGFYASVPDTRASDLLTDVKNAADSITIVS
jgi:hypothetical protein